MEKGVQSEVTHCHGLNSNKAKGVPDRNMSLRLTAHGFLAPPLPDLKHLYQSAFRKRNKVVEVYVPDSFPGQSHNESVAQKVPSRHRVCLTGTAGEQYALEHSLLVRRLQGFPLSFCKHASH